MSAATPVNLLTEDQAVEELAQIMDAAPDESDQLEFIRWKQAHSARAQQLEQHIIHLHKVAEANAQDAPPHHLQPEPEPGPAPAKERKTMTKEPEEKLATAIAYYKGVLARVKARPGDRTLRDLAQKAACMARAAAKKGGLPVPELEALPPIPDPKPRGGARPVDQKPAAALPPEPLMEKAGPGPYVPPTPSEIWDAMKATGDGRSQEFPVPSPCAEDCVHPEHHHTTVNSGGRPLDLPYATPGIKYDPTAADLARGIQRAFWPLCHALDAMPDREAIRPALDVIHARLQTAYALLDEATLSDAG